MAKPVTFTRKPAAKTTSATNFDFGANAPTFTTKAPAPRGTAKKDSARKTQYAMGGGS